MHTVQKEKSEEKNFTESYALKKHLCPLFTKILVPISSTVLALTLRVRY